MVKVLHMKMCHVGVCIRIPDVARKQWNIGTVEQLSTNNGQQFVLISASISIKSTLRERKFPINQDILINKELR